MYSLKMRASACGSHVSGAEKIVPRRKVAQCAERLAERALSHSKGGADFVNIKIEQVPPGSLLELDCLPVRTVSTASWQEGIGEVRAFIEGLGCRHAEKVLDLFRETYQMRGAMLLDIRSLERLEPDKSRGIRATYMDCERADGAVSCGKNHFLEAVVLATKVANAPGIAGEICISDDPDYVTGYVASKKSGYVRITRLKERGSPCGGRIFLYDGEADGVEAAVDFLERQRVIVRNVVLPDSVRRSAAEVNPSACGRLRGKFDFMEEELLRLKEGSLFRTCTVLESVQSSHVRCGGRDCLMLASNSYLDMISRRDVQERAAEALRTFGFGSGGSRLTTGTTSVHRRLEERLAAFKGTEDCIVFNSGYAANVSAISALAGRGAVIFSDELNHASIIDGCRLSRADVVVYAHNDMRDLEEKIRLVRPQCGLIVSDAVFSMDGDILNLPEFVALGEKYNMITMVDEAHSTGVIGRTGRGILEHFGFECAPPDILMGTLSKALGSEGGFVCASKTAVSYLMNKARGYIFSTALSPVAMAASCKALEILEAEPELVRRLQENVRFFCGELQAHGVGAKSDTAIVPIMVGDEGAALRCQTFLLERGIFISAIRHPAVAKGAARLRAALMATHEKAELAAAAAAVADAIGAEKGQGGGAWT